MEVITPELRKNLSQQNWEDIILKLTSYANYIIKRLCWNSSYGNLPRGLKADDIALEAIEKVWTGSRNWNPDKIPDLLLYLKGVVKSLLSNLVNSNDNRKYIISIDQTNCQSNGDLIDQIKDNSSSIDSTVEFEEIRKMIWKDIKWDEDEFLVLTGLEEGLKPKQISEELNLSIDKVYIVQKRIKRKVEKLLKEKIKIEV